MFLWGGTSNNQVIDVPVAKVEVLYYFINEALKCLSCVLPAERHAHELEKAKWCSDGNLLGMSSGASGMLAHDRYVKR